MFSTPPPPLGEFYPSIALRHEVEGRVTLRCAAMGGRLACSVAGDEPAIGTFGPPALAYANALAIGPQLRDSSPVEGRCIDFELRFALAP